MEFVFGFIGAILAVFLLAVGAAAGWKLRAAVQKRTQTIADPPSEVELRRMREEQQAFSKLQNYTLEDAYGMNEGDLSRHAAQRGTDDK